MTPRAAMRRAPLMLAGWFMAGAGGWLLAWQHPERGWLLVAAGTIAAFLALWWE